MIPPLSITTGERNEEKREKKEKEEEEEEEETSKTNSALPEHHNHARTR